MEDRNIRMEWVKDLFSSFSIKSPKRTLSGHLKWGLIVLETLSLVPFSLYSMSEEAKSYSKTGADSVLKVTVDRTLTVLPCE